METISKGSKQSDSVKLIKQRLNDLGFGPLNVNNPNFGDTTEQEVKKFQKSKQLLDDGEVGKLTWARLFEQAVPQEISFSLRLRALQIAKSQLGVREKTGKNDGEEVKAYLNSIGLGEGYAWCAAFIYWCFDKAAKELGMKNPLPKTGGVLDHLRKTKGKIVKIPQPGDIGIMDFGGGKGHEFIVEEVRDRHVFNVEGNTNDASSREGDGVYERSRPITSIKAFIRYEDTI